MRNQPRYSLVRRILFPYSGEEPLTRKQGLQVVLVWAFLLPLPLVLCTLVASVAFSFSLSRSLLTFAVAFLAGALIFGLLAWAVVGANNRGARIYQQRRTRKGQF